MILKSLTQNKDIPSHLSVRQRYVRLCVSRQRNEYLIFQITLTKYFYDQKTVNKHLTVQKMVNKQPRMVKALESTDLTRRTLVKF